jgi:hypothetical protein
MPIDYYIVFVTLMMGKEAAYGAFGDSRRRTDTAHSLSTLAVLEPGGS